jgi:hypothetical protein
VGGARFSLLTGGGTLVGAANPGSGKFAMIDGGLGFSLVPWQPVLEQRPRRQTTGVAMPGGGIDWTFGRSQGLGLSPCGKPARGLRWYSEQVSLCFAGPSTQIKFQAVHSSIS